MSSILALMLVFTNPADAHEVFPTILDMRQEGDRLVFELGAEVGANLESFVAGIDLADVTDTDEAAQAADYDALRAMESAEFEARFQDFWPDMASNINIVSGEAHLTPVLVSVFVPEIGDPEVLRPSTVVFTVELPAGATSVQVGWDSAFGGLVLRQIGVENPYDGYLTNGAMSDPVQLEGGSQAAPWQVFRDYIPVGFDHIVPKGLDHILFVLGLFFLSTRLNALLWQISAFTLAHTITLALAALGYIAIPGAVVEPLIAASIVFVAVENIFMRGLSHWRPVVIFGFGLLHGLGFASVLGEFGLPEGSFVPALIGFNFGVEIGQLAVVAMALGAVTLAVRVDRGKNQVGIATGFYAISASITAGLGVVAYAAPTLLGGGMWGEVPVWVFMWPMAAILALCLISVINRDQIDAYRRIVSIPASSAIALVAAWWVVERVFL